MALIVHEITVPAYNGYKSLIKTFGYTSPIIDRYLYGTIFMDDTGKCGIYELYDDNNLLYDIDEYEFTLVHGIDGVEYNEPYIYRFTSGNKTVNKIIFYTPGCYVFKSGNDFWTAQINAIKIPGYSLWVRDIPYKEHYHPSAAPIQLFTFDAVNGKKYEYDIEYYVFVDDDSFFWDRTSGYKVRLLTASGVPETDYSPAMDPELTPTVTEDSIFFDKNRYYIGNIPEIGPASCVDVKAVFEINGKQNLSITYLLGYINIISGVSHIQRVGGSQLFCYLEDGTVIPFQRSGKNLYGYGSMQLSGVDYGSYMEVSIDGGDSVIMDYWQKRGIYVPRGGDDG